MQPRSPTACPTLDCRPGCEVHGRVCRSDPIGGSPTALSPSRLSTGIFEVQGCDRPNIFGKTDHELLDLQFRPHMTIISNEPKSTVRDTFFRGTCSPLSTNQSSLHCQRLAFYARLEHPRSGFSGEAGSRPRSCHTQKPETWPLLPRTCKIALPARVAKRSARTARRTAVVAKAAAPVDAVRVQQKVRDEPC